MFRKTLIVAAAAAALTLGTISAQAAAPVYLGAPTVEAGSVVEPVGHYKVVCKWVRVKYDYGWKRVKKCHKVFYKHYKKYSY
jgi:hypothetical protein